MNKNWSPLGNALLDYYEENPTAVIVIQSSIEQDRYVSLSNFFRYKNNLPKLEKLALAKCRGKILDVGAGAGTHSLLLQEQGADITAMDISEEAVDVMRKRGIKNVFAGDIFNYNPEEKYDTLLMLMNGIGLSANLEGLEKFLAHAKTSLLKKDGQIVLDSTDLHYVKPDSLVRASIKKPSGEYYGIVWYQLEYKGRKGEPYSWLFVDQDLLKEKAAAAGFKMEVLYEEDDQYLACLGFS